MKTLSMNALSLVSGGVSSPEVIVDVVVVPEAESCKSTGFCATMYSYFPSLKTVGYTVLALGVIAGCLVVKKNWK